MLILTLPWRFSIHAAREGWGLRHLFRLAHRRYVRFVHETMDSLRALRTSNSVRFGVSSIPLVVCSSLACASSICGCCALEQPSLSLFLLAAVHCFMQLLYFFSANSCIVCFDCAAAAGGVAADDVAADAARPARPLPQVRFCACRRLVYFATAVLAVGSGRLPGSPHYRFAPSALTSCMRSACSHDLQSPAASLSRW